MNTAGITHPLITAQHLARKALIYIRQSTPHQVLSHQESHRLQYALRERALQLGWHEEDLDVIDRDLGLSGQAASNREGFKEMPSRVALGEVGLILAYEVTRLCPWLLRLVPALGSMWLPRLPHCRHRWHL